MGSDYSPLPNRPGAGGFCSLGLGFPTYDLGGTYLPGLEPGFQGVRQGELSVGAS